MNIPRVAPILLAALCLPASAQVSGSATAPAHDLSAQQLQLARQVHTGRMPCALGMVVTVNADRERPGHFFVRGQGFDYHMVPVETRTGAIRLEDHKGGGVWLQIAEQSMLMNQKLGRRLATDCTSAAQVHMRKTLRHTPQVGVLDAP